jgi:hypothetical protein
VTPDAGPPARRPAGHVLPKMIMAMNVTLMLADEH